MQHRELFSFLEKLMERVRLSPNLPPNEVHVFNVHASYGHYQIVIGPAEKIFQNKHPMRPIEINGAIHHLFVTKNQIAPHPSSKQIHDNLKGCVIMRDLTIHLKDPTGTGRKVEKGAKESQLVAREKINLAGPDGEKFMKRMEHTGRLLQDTYKIVQEDILSALADKQYTME